MKGTRNHQPVLKSKEGMESVGLSGVSSISPDVNGADQESLPSHMKSFNHKHRMSTRFQNNTPLQIIEQSKSEGGSDEYQSMIVIKKKPQKIIVTTEVGRKFTVGRLNTQFGVDLPPQINVQKLPSTCNNSLEFIITALS